MENNMTVSTQPYKGARDFFPEDKRLQNYMFGVLRRVAERFGYEEYDAPILEPTELFLMKGNQEIIDEQTYTFLDRGGRSVTVRTEMTPTVSRMVAARRQELVLPARWYSIPNVWRYERMQRGRLREFWQLNVDIFGVETIAAEVEMVQIVDAIFKEFGAKQDQYSVHVNSRKLTDYALGTYLGLDSVQVTTMVRLIDRINKMERAVFEAQVDALLSPAQRDSGGVERLLKLLEAKSLDELPPQLKQHASVLELQLMFETLSSMKIHNAVFDMSLMRGFDYYTDIVFEVFDSNPENNRAMFGGGRYDGLVAQFGVEPLPTVGFGMGDVTLQNFLTVHDLLPKIATETDVYVVLIGSVYDKAANVLSKMRKMGLNVAVDLTGRKLDKQIRAADRKGVQYVMFIGEQELVTEQYKIKDLRSGTEEMHGIERIVSIVKDRRRTQIDEDD
jgi:histidyl-tRNA synthetase